MLTDAQIIDDILQREGSAYTQIAEDRGGATKYGITQRSWDDYIANDPANAPTRDVASLDEAMARKFYQEVYVTPLAWIRKDGLRALVVDSAVQHGMPTAVRWLQSAAGVGTDGRVGPDTIAAVNLRDQLDEVYAKVLRSRITYYGDLVTRDPSQAKFASGWNRRAARFVR